MRPSFLLPALPRVPAVHLRRHPALFWLFAVVLSGVTGLVVLRLVGEAQAAAARYGALLAVPVTSGPVGAGDVVQRSDIVWRREPRAFLPAAAVARTPVGRTAIVPLVAGEVVLDARLAPRGMRGPPALVPPGARALAVPVGPSSPPVARGDRVDVLATLDGSTPPTFAVAARAVVVEAAPTRVTVAVSAEEAPRVAYAITRGAVTLALDGPP
jgi:Flp pilus assembly protein CpaB